MNRQYEVLFILAPKLTEDEAAEMARTMQKIVERKGGVCLKVENWGKRRLAYPIKKNVEGTYVLFVIEGGAEPINELERKFKQTDEVIRFITVRTDVEQKALAKKIMRRRAEEDRRAARKPIAQAAAAAAEALANE